MSKNKEKTAAMKRAFKEKMKTKAKDRKQKLKEHRAKLIVKNLPFAVTTENLKAHFETYGKVVNVQLLKKEDGHVIGCGFVQFEAVQKAAKARHHLNGKEFLGRALSCDFALPKKEFEKKQQKEKRKKYLEETKIKEEIQDPDYLKNEIKEEDKSGNEEELVEDEKEEENVATKSDSDVQEIDEENTNNESNYSRSDSSSSESEDEDDDEDDKVGEENAVDKGSPTQIKSQKKPRFESHDVNEGRTIFIKNLPFDATNEDLKECMEQFGPVHYALICVDKMTEHSKGTGFVKFHVDADKCLQAGTELTLMDTILDCHRAIDRREVTSKTATKEKQKDLRNLYLIKEGVILAGTKAAEGVSAGDMAKRLQLEQYKTQMLRNLNHYISRTRLIVHNLPTTWDDAKLRALMKKHAGAGAVIREARVMRNMRQVDAAGVGASKEHGFVTFTSHEHALQALRSLNNNPHVFTEAKRPIVAFSIENRVMVNAKSKRMEKSRQLNPLAKQFSAEVQKEHMEWKAKKKQQEVGAETEVTEGGVYTGTKGKPGQVQKLRSRYKLKVQAQLHQEQLKKERKDKKCASAASKTLQQKKAEFIRQDGQKVNKEKRGREMMDDDFAKMVNSYKSKLLKGGGEAHKDSKLEQRGKWADG